MTIAAVSGQNGGATASAEVDTYAYASNVSLGSLIVIIGFQRDINGNTTNPFAVGDCTKSAGTAVLDTIQMDIEAEVAFINSDLWVRGAIWSAIVTTAGSLTMQVSNGTGAEITDTHIHGHEFTGSWDGTRVEDTGFTEDATDDVDPALSTTVTSAGDGLFVCAVSSGDPATIDWANVVEFTDIADTANTAEGNSEANSGYQLVTGATTDEGSWGSSGHKGYEATIVAYKEAAGGTAYTQSVAGGLTPSGAVDKETAKALAGSLPLAGALITASTFARVLTGTLTPAGSLNKDTTKSFAGSLTPTGATRKETQKSFAGSLTPTGTLSTLIIFIRSIAGALTPTGALSKLTLKNLMGALTPAGTVTRETQKNLTGGVTPAGVTSKETQKDLAGSVTPAGDTSPSLTTLQSVAGAFAPSGALSTVFQPFVASVISRFRRLTTVISSLRHNRR